MTLKELLAQLKATSESLGAIDSQINELVAKDELTDEEKTEHDKLVTKREQLAEKHARQTKAVAAEKARIARDEQERQIANDIDNLESRRPLGTGRKTSADVGTEDTPALTVKEPAFLQDPKRGFKDHREFLLTVMKAGERGGYTEDQRLKSLASFGNGLDRHMAAGSDEQSTISDAYGGYLIPMGFSPNLMSVQAEADPIAGLTTKIPMTNPVVPINARVDKNHTSSVSGGFQVFRRVETQAVTATRQQYEQVVLNANSLFGVAYATEELLARSPISFMALIEAGFRDEFVAKLLDERLNGTGTGMYEGIVNSPARILVDRNTNGTIIKEDIDNMRARCWGYGKAVWLYNHDCLPALRSLYQTIGVGGSAVPYFSVDTNGNSTLDGRPAYATEFTQTIGTVGDLVLGNWSQYLEGTLTGISSAESIHVRFENHERVFKFWTENDGRGWWRSALTPKRSSSTLSPFVLLDT